MTSAPPPSGLIINLVWDADALAAPQSFRDAVQAAANMLDAAIYDPIVVNISVGYGELQGTPLTGGVAEGGPYEIGETYANLRALLASHETSAADVTSVNALPNTTSLNGRASFFIATAEAKAFGVFSATNPAIDGVVGFATDIPSGLLVGVALHELTHAMGRSPGATAFSLFRYTSPGNHLFTFGTPAASSYFSIDGGLSKLADFGTSSDAGDFLNPPTSNLTPNDAFNEFYTGTTLQSLTAVDLTMMDVLGFNVTSPLDTTAPILVNETPLRVAVGATRTITSSLLRFDDNVSSHAQETYSVVVAPLDGTLLRNGSATSTFTQADIDNGLISYHEIAGKVSSNSFVFTVTDAANNTTAAQQFQFQIVTQPVAGDFDGDGISDILWRNDDGSMVIWDMNADGTRQQAVGNYVVPNTWQIDGTGGFNGDGISDILWRNNDGSLAIWDMNADGTRQQAVGNYVVSTDWQIAGTGDFNGDGISDILWRNNDGSLAIWDMNADGTRQQAVGNYVVSTDWQIAGTGDFNGDGISDILWRNNDGSLAIWDMNADGTIQHAVGGYVVSTDWQIAGTGDFNGDDISDILWRNSDGAVAIWDMNADGTRNQAVGNYVVPTDWQIAGTGDFNGDGISDILWRNSDGAVAIWDMNADGTRSQAVGNYVVPTDWHLQGG